MSQKKQKTKSLADLVAEKLANPPMIPTPTIITPAAKPIITTTTKSPKEKCPYCGKKYSQSRIKNHLKTCEQNPDNYLLDLDDDTEFLEISSDFIRHLSGSINNLRAPTEKRILETRGKIGQSVKSIRSFWNSKKLVQKGNKYYLTKK